MKPTPRGYIEPVKRFKKCKPCKGTGLIGKLTCPKCLGFGEVVE